MMFLIKILTLIITFIKICASDRGELFIEYGVGGQGFQLMRYYFDVQNGFYVDIGAYDAIFASNTLNLYVQGWNGINVDASPERINRFFMLRPDQANLNFAIGQQDVFSVLYELEEDSSSTISPKVKDYVKDLKPVMSQIKVPSLTLKQLCERFYHRKPIFMNLDVQGYGGKVLEGNDWSNPKCVPELIISEINEEVIKAGYPIPNQILVKHGYIKLNKTVGLNQIYIHQSVFTVYMQKEKSSRKYLASLQQNSVVTIGSTLARYLRMSTIMMMHYQPTRDMLVHKFVKANEVIDLIRQNAYYNNLILQNNMTHKNRPILIYHFHPNSNIIVIQKGCRWETKHIQYENFDFLEINITQGNNTRFSVYILNHHYQNVVGFNPRIFDLNKDFHVLQEQKQYRPVPAKQHIKNQTAQKQQKQIQLVCSASFEMLTSIRNQSQLLKRVQKGQQTQGNGLRNTFLSNHNIEINLIQKISTKLQDLSKSIQSQLSKIDKKQYKQNGEQEFKEISKMELQIQNLKLIQNVVLALICFMSLSLCVTICIKSRRNLSKKHNQTQQ